MAVAWDAAGGDVIGRNIFGLALDHRGDPLLINERTVIHSDSEFDQRIRVEDRAFMVSGFKESFGSIYVTSMDKESQKAIDTVGLDTSSLGGLAYPSGGLLTAWNSILFSEAKHIDAARSDSFIEDYKPYYKGKSAMVNPYNYGWVSELIVLDKLGKAKAIKNYAMGRVFASQVVMMPDGKTFYLLDGTGSGQLYLFIAEQANSLAKGSLYWLSMESDKLKRHFLGKTSALKMKFKLKKASFDAFFDSVLPGAGACDQGFTYINTLYGEECLKLKKKNKKYAPMFEPIRFAALKAYPGSGDNIQSLKLDEAGQRLIMDTGGKQALAYSFVHDAQLDSHYIIQELR